MLKKKASKGGSHIIKSKLLIHFNSFKKNLRLRVGCFAEEGVGVRTPHVRQLTCSNAVHLNHTSPKQSRLWPFRRHQNDLDPGKQS